MNKKVAGVVVAMVLVLGAAAPVWAQRSWPMKVTVPFSFVVENEVLPAGEYRIERAATGRLRIQSNDGRRAASFLAIPKQGKVTAENAHIIFHRYGSEYFMATIWTPGQDAGWEVLQGKLETELAKKRTSPVETAMVRAH